MFQKLTDRREDGAGGVVTGETGLAHAGPVVHHQSGYLLVTHVDWLLWCGLTLWMEDGGSLVWVSDDVISQNSCQRSEERLGGRRCGEVGGRSHCGVAASCNTIIKRSTEIITAK